MNRFVVGFALVACAMGAPSGIVAPAGYANVGAVGYAHGGAVVGPAVAHAPAVVGQTHHSYAAGPAVVENRVEYGVVGQRTVQTGVASVVAGHQYAVAGHEAISQPPLMLPEPHRTSLRPEPSQPQLSQLPQHHMLPSHLHQSQLVPPQLIP